MTPPAAHSWLPVETVLRPQVRARLEEAVVAWSTAWFPSRHIVVTGGRAITGALRARPDRPVFGKATAIGYSARAVARLLDWALDTALDEVTVLPADQQVLDGFEHRMIEDLAQRIEAGIGAAKATTVDASQVGGLEVTIGEDAGGDLITAVLSFEVLLPAIRASLLPPSPRPPLDVMDRAIAPSAISVEAVLGYADIPLSALQDLASGDILVLQARLEDGAALSVVGSQRPFGRGDLAEIDGHRAVTLIK